MKAAFAGSIAVRLAEPVRRRLTIPCEIVTGDEAAILHQLGDASVLVSMAFTKEMAIAGPNLRLVQVPGAGLDRIERSQIRLGLALANAYGHEAGIAEYVIGAMIAITRSFQRLDQKLRAGQWESQWSIGTPAPPIVAGAGRQNARHFGFWAYRRSAGAACPRVRHEGMRGQTARTIGCAAGVDVYRRTGTA